MIERTVTVRPNRYLRRLMSGIAITTQEYYENRDEITAAESVLWSQAAKSRRDLCDDLMISAERKGAELTH
jgi:hypothetical protein